MVRLLIYLLIAFVVWKIVRIFMSGRRLKEKEPEQKIDFPPDKSYKNIEDADFEDIGPDSNKTP